MAGLSESYLFWVSVAILALVFIALVSPLMLVALFRPTEMHEEGTGRQVRITSLFQVPYASWFLLHYAIAATAILIIALLGLAGVIDKGVVSALIGSLLGYVLGSSNSARVLHPGASAGGRPSEPGQRGPAGQPASETK